MIKMKDEVLLRRIEQALLKQPGATVVELAVSLRSERSLVNRLLYSQQDRFGKLDMSPPGWYVKHESTNETPARRGLTERETQILARHGVTCLYSLQPLSTLESIERHGIVSRNKRRALGLTGVDLSELRSQTARGQRLIDGHPLHDYVPLFFRPLTPMQYKICVTQRKRDVVALLEIDIEVFGIPGVRFTAGNAKTAKIHMHPSELSELDWGILDTPEAWSREYVNKKSAEVLVPNVVLPSLIRNVCVASTHKELPALSLSCVIDDSLFSQF